MPADLSDVSQLFGGPKKCRQLPAMEVQATLQRMDIQSDFGLIQPAATEAAQQEANKQEASTTLPMAVEPGEPNPKAVLAGFVRATPDADEPQQTAPPATSAVNLDLAAGYWQMYAKCLLAADEEEGPPESAVEDDNAIKFHDNGDSTYHMLGVENLPPHRLSATTVQVCNCITVQMLRRILSPFTKGKISWPVEDLDSVLQDLVPRSLERYTKEMEKLHNRTVQLNDITAGGTTGRLGLGALFGLKSKPAAAEMAIYCPACQADNLPNAATCKSCGSKPPWTTAGLAKEKVKQTSEKVTICTGRLGKNPDRLNWADATEEDIGAWEVIRDNPQATVEKQIDSSDSEAEPPEVVGNSAVLDRLAEQMGIQGHISDSDDEPVTDLAAGILQAAAKRQDEALPGFKSLIKRSRAALRRETKQKIESVSAPPSYIAEVAEKAKDYDVTMATSTSLEATQLRAALDRREGKLKATGQQGNPADGKENPSSPLEAWQPIQIWDPALRTALEKGTLSSANATVEDWTDARMLQLRQKWRESQRDISAALPDNYFVGTSHRLLESLPLKPGETQALFHTEESKLNRLKEIYKQYGTELRQVKAWWKWTPEPLPDQENETAWWGFGSTGRWTRERTPDRNTVLQPQGHKPVIPERDPVRGMPLRAESEDGQGHFVKEFRTVDIYTMIYDHGSKHTLEEIIELWTKLPVLAKTNTRGSQATSRRNHSRYDALQEQKDKAKEWLTANGFNRPLGTADLKAVHKKIGRWLGACHFLVDNPTWLMSLPKQAERDDRQTLWERCEFDERITVPLDALIAMMPPKVIKSYQDLLLRGEMAVATGHYRCNGRMTVDGKEFECGLILPALTGWTHSVRDTKSSIKKHGKNCWMCQYCSMAWGKYANGTRFVQVYCKTTVLQLILDEPPQKLWNEWARQRIEYYERLEPSAPKRDVYPSFPKEGEANRVRFQNKDSDDVWQLLLNNNSAKLSAAIDHIVVRGHSSSTEATLGRVNDDGVVLLQGTN